MGRKFIITEGSLEYLIKQCIRRPINESMDFDFNLGRLFINIDNNNISVREDEPSLAPGRVYEVTLFVSDYKIENHGIGNYEFWGTQYYDKGEDQYVIKDLDIDDITSLGYFEEDGDVTELDEKDDVGLTDEQMQAVVKFGLRNLDEMGFYD